MRTVQELFREIKTNAFAEEEFIKYYLRFDNNTVSYDTVKSLLSELCQTKRVRKNTENYIIFSIPHINDLRCDSFLIKQNDLNKEKQETYAYELTKIKDILGYFASEACIRYLGKFSYLSSILYEISFFDYKLSDREKKITKECKSLNNYLKEVNEEKLISFEKFKKMINWKDDREKFEKDFDDATVKIESEFLLKIKKELVDLEKMYINKLQEVN